MKKSYWAINFDLNTKAMQELLGSKTIGYKMVKKAMKELDFRHRQGSGYLSKNKIDRIRLEETIKILTAKQPWLSKCVNRLDTTIVNKKNFDYADIVKSYDQNVTIEALPEEYTLADYVASVRTVARKTVKENYDEDVLE